MYYRNVLDSKGWFNGGRTVGIVQLYWVLLRIVNDFESKDYRNVLESKGWSSGSGGIVQL